jgi:diphosphomevalonate decarboxylase
MSNEPFVISYSSSSGSGKITWRSPCSIELIKHFGEREHHLPLNSSLSMSLTEAFAEASIEYELIEALSSPGVHCSLDGLYDQDIVKSISSFVENAVIDVPILQHLRMNISARLSSVQLSDFFSITSVYSSLALCLCSIEENVNGSITGPMDFFKKSSYLARLGAGNACRSVYGGYVVWGKSDDYNEFSNFYANPLPFEVHPNFQQMEYAILEIALENNKFKDITSHSFMKAHPYAGGRFDQARNNLNKLLSALKSGDHTTFVEVVEDEALSLRAIMMSSSKDAILLKPESITIIEEIRSFRNNTHIPLCFTLDTSPNIHLLYPAVNKEQVSAFVQKDLIFYCESKRILYDRIGKGTERVQF